MSTEVYVFGSGDCGQLGLGEDVWSAEKPAKHDFFADKGIVAIAAGGLHSLALGKDGKVWSWGCNDEKALGHEQPEFSVGLVQGLENKHIVQIACGDSISAALTDNGEVWTWGTFRDSKGLLGHSATGADLQERPGRLEALSKTKITQIAAGANHLMAVTAEGQVYAWGAGEQGQLGRRILERHKRSSALRPCNVTPRSGRGFAHITRIACGAYHTLALSSDGSVYASGLNNHGQLGLNDFRERINPELVESGVWQGHQIIQMSAGEHHSMALSSTGVVFAFGRNDSGQCGLLNDPSKPPIPTPTTLPPFPAPIIMISSGSNHNLAVDSNNIVYSWGFGEMCQLGHGGESDAPVPRPIQAKHLPGRAIQVSAGGQHSVVLVSRQ